MTYGVYVSFSRFLHTVQFVTVLDPTLRYNFLIPPVAYHVMEADTQLQLVSGSIPVHERP